MGNRFSSGKNSISQCDRCNFRFKLHELKTEIIKTKPYQLKVCRQCWDPDHPQLQLGMYPVDDPQGVRDPRPDITYLLGGTLPDGTTKIFPQGVGQKLSPKIPQCFPNYIRYKNIAGKRIMQLVSDPMIDLANTRPDAFKEKTLPIETGLAEFFGALKGQASKPAGETPRPKSLILRRA